MSVYKLLFSLTYLLALIPTKFCSTIKIHRELRTWSEVCYLRLPRPRAFTLRADTRVSLRTPSRASVYSVNGPPTANPHRTALHDSTQPSTCRVASGRRRVVWTRAAAPASKVEAVVRSLTNTAAAQIAAADFNKITSK